MKTKILNSLALLVTLFFVSCEPDLRMPEVTQVAFPKLTLTPTSDVLIQGGVLNGSVVVDLYYENDNPTDAKLVVTMNGDYSNVKTLEESVTTFPSTYNVTDEQLVSLFGLTSINPGDYFEVGLNVKEENGVWYPAFNPEGVGYGSGPMNLPGASPIIKFKAVCALDIDNFVGLATIVDPFWYEGTYTAQIVKDDATHLRIKNYAEFTGDLVVEVNPVTHTLKVTNSVFDTNLAAWGLASYTNPKASGSGEIDACNNKMSITLGYSVDQGSFSGTGTISISY